MNRFIRKGHFLKSIRILYNVVSYIHSSTVLAGNNMKRQIIAQSPLNKSFFQDII